ncbi:transcriptional regulator [Longilinea arvoryzae]|uniref:Transcriptional regulator n=1 Tax=Longilinea arvoryzae TaxID=360412 RepID=A0A0S7BDK5_9CHLR|nr:TetR/AcrR family transcriptional regulator [Longilinea arvoryzae]GAP15870.1 transcriptional regulator [Longilinea arvoryzae]
MQRADIIQATLELIQEKESASRVNLRAVARALGCAHTNIYNYFDDFDDLLWAALDTAGDRFIADVTAGVKSTRETTTSLNRFFAGIIDFYLVHKGWLRLFWADPLKGPRPVESAALGEKRVASLALLFGDAVQETCGINLPQTEAYHLLHEVHCYLYGEMSINISGRGLIPEENAFRAHLLQECLTLTDLLIR